MAFTPLDPATEAEGPWQTIPCPEFEGMCSFRGRVLNPERDLWGLLDDYFEKSSNTLRRSPSAFRIRMASGQVFDIRHPEMILVGRTSVQVHARRER